METTTFKKIEAFHIHCKRGCLKEASDGGFPFSFELISHRCTHLKNPWVSIF